MSEVQWWYWIVAGCVLCLAELAVPALILIWLGIAALITGVFVFALPLSPIVQLLVWGVLSVLMTFVFLRFFKPHKADLPVGRSDEILDETGLLTRAVVPYGRGEILFQKPVLGSDRWNCVADHAIAAGVKVRVQSVEGSVLRVEEV